MKKGVILLLLSSLFFTLATVFARLANIQYGIPGVEITFFRFLIGFTGALVYLIFKKENLRPVNVRYVALRSLLNTVAVVIFFTGIQFTTVTNANMLNMTYPVFVYLFAPYINKEKNPPVYYLYLAFTLAGIYLIINPNFSSILLGDILALVSGIIAAGAISVLREARKYDSAFIIFFYLMGSGVFINFFMMFPFFVMPEGQGVLYLFLAALSGAVGQIFITVGYRYIDAASGSLVSSTRILFAGFLGAAVFSDSLTLQLVIGGILIVLSLAGVSGRLRKTASDSGPV